MNNKIRVAMLDDHAAVIEGYLSRLRESSNTEVVGVAACGEAIELILAAKPADVLILDLGVSISLTNRAPYPVLLAIPRLIDTYPNLKILVISMHGQAALIQAVMKAGARGYILKDDPTYLPDLPAIIETVAHGGTFFSRQVYEVLFHRHGNGPLLTQRQLQALSLCAAYPQESTMQLAKRLKMAPSTMRNLLSSAYDVMDVHSRVAAVARAQQLGYLQQLEIPVDLRSMGDHSVSSQ